MSIVETNILYDNKELECELGFIPPYPLSKDNPGYRTKDCKFVLISASIHFRTKIKSVDIICREHITRRLSQSESGIELKEIEELAIQKVCEKEFI